MNDQPTQVPLDPFADTIPTGRPNEVPACPTGLSDTPETVIVPAPLTKEGAEKRLEEGLDSKDWYFSKKSV